MAMPSIAPQIVVTIGDVSRSYHAFVTDAPQKGDAPATMTLYAAALADVGFFAATQIVFDVSRARSSARLVLVDEAELTWERARCREGQHLMAPADANLVGRPALQSWLWRRLRRCIGNCEIGMERPE